MIICTCTFKHTYTHMHNYAHTHACRHAHTLTHNQASLISVNAYACTCTGHYCMSSMQKECMQEDWGLLDHVSTKDIILIVCSHHDASHLTITSEHGGSSASSTYTTVKPVQQALATVE